jgi:hypothetical protein
MSVSLTGVNSRIFVDGENATVAGPLGCVTWIVVPDTDATCPNTRSLPLAGAVTEDDADGDGVPVALGEALDDPLLDEPHAATDSAVTPMTASTACAQLDG